LPRAEAFCAEPANNLGSVLHTMDAWGFLAVAGIVVA